MEPAVTMLLARVLGSSRVYSMGRAWKLVVLSEVSSRGEILILRISPVPTAGGILAAAGGRLQLTSKPISGAEPVS